MMFTFYAQVTNVIHHMVIREFWLREDQTSRGTNSRLQLRLHGRQQLFLFAIELLIVTRCLTGNQGILFRKTYSFKVGIVFGFLKVVVFYLILVYDSELTTGKYRSFSISDHLLPCASDKIFHLP